MSACLVWTASRRRPGSRPIGRGSGSSLTALPRNCARTPWRQAPMHSFPRERQFANCSTRLANPVAGHQADTDAGLASKYTWRVSAPGAARHLPPLPALLSTLGFAMAGGLGAPTEQASVLATFAASQTFRWLRRWAVVAVVALVTPITVFTAYANQMPEFHHLAVPIAVAFIVPAWVAELLGVRWPRLVLIAATVVPNIWLTLIGHISTNYLWFLLLVCWVAFAG